MVSCGGENEEIIIDGGGIVAKAKVNFINNREVVLENEVSVTIRLIFDKATTENSNLELAINEISGVYNEDYTTLPEPNGDIISIPVQIGLTEVSFTVNLISDDDNDDEEIQFSISSATGGLELGTSNTTITLIIQEEESPVDSKYDPCLDDLSDTELNVVTWNIEFFPMADANTVAAVEEIVTHLDADIIAVQEINSINEFNRLGSNIPGWNSTVVNLSGSLDIGYLYKADEITILDDAESVLNGDVSPRPPVSIRIRHINGLEVTLLNIHLKCCNDGVSRRQSASIAMKDYIDANLDDEHVIILGDFNDDINGGSPFTNFISDTENYVFADADIAAGSSSNWSYPSWPSHIDHILITNELFDNFIESKTIKFEGCLNNYSSIVSDHRPVMASFRN